VDYDAMISLYPNPSQGYLHIKSDIKNNINDIKVYNIKGEELTLRTQISADGIDMSSLTNGVYFITFDIGTTHLTKKIVILNE
jgi:hypothetical protein